MLANIAKKIGPNWPSSCVLGRSAVLALALACTCAGSAPTGWIQHTTYSVTPLNTDSASLISGPNGDLWFVEELGNALASVTTAGVVTEYPIPWSNNPSAMVLGPDGALWFTENQVGIGRFSPSSGFSQYAMPASAMAGGDVFLGAITVGPDGALWFLQGAFCEGAACAGPNVGRITTSGAITLYPISASASDIVAGPDGALWFTEGFSANAIARITTAGVLTEYSLPTINSYPSAITVGSDGALWFLEAGLYYLPGSGGRVGRITTTGSLSEYTVQPSSTVTINGASNLVAGPDGALWFELITSSASSSGLLRMTTDGAFGSYSLNGIGLTNTEFYPSGTIGPDGALWFSADEQLARVPACGLGLNASFANSQLTLKFNGGAPIPTIWQTGFYYGTDSFQGLWSLSVAAVDQSDPFTASFGFPSIGYIAPFSLLRDAANSDPLCAEWQIVNTGGSGGVTEEEAQSSILKLLKQ